MAKVDPTTRFINDNQRRPDFVRTEINPGDAPPNRVNVPRLCVSGFKEPLPFTFESLANRATASALPNHAFFVDTCFVKKEVPNDCWDALLTKTVFVTPWIKYELREWLSNPNVNIGFHARYKNGLRGNDDRVEFLPAHDSDADLTKVVSHYVSLLACRKDIFKTMRERLIHETGKEPTEDAVKRRVQSLVRDRGMTIATKGLADADKPNFMADEDLIVRAFVFALATGRDVTVLTRDRDLSEQFYKLQYLIDTHYRSFLLADAFATQPLNFRRYDDPKSKLELDGFDSIAVYRMPAGMPDRLLPAKYDFVNIHVERIVESGPNLLHTVLSFSAETKMAEMLRAKGRTNGLNTDRLAGKNLHRCIHPDLQGVFGTCMGVVDDRFVENEDGRWSLTDIQLAITPCERSGSLREIEQPESRIAKQTLAQAFDIANFTLPKRLTPTHSTDWVSTHVEAVSLAIEMMKPWTRILISRELVDDLPSRLVEALASKDCLALPSNQTLPHSIDTIDPLPANGGRKIVDYYTALLSHRKMFGRWCEEYLVRKSGKTPSRKQVQKELQKYCDASCWLRSKDYFDRPSDPYVFDDEHLVVDAFFRAVCNGRETILLTRRPTLIDQFWTLASLIQSHYRAWALARNDSGRFRELVLDTDRIAPAFASNLFKVDYSATQMEKCLPSGSIEIGVQAWCVNGSLENRFSVYPVGFGVEPAMVEMFRIKEENAFRVHDWADDRNVHMQYSADESGRELGSCFVGIDHNVKVGSNDFPSDLRLPLTVDAVPAFDITLMIAMDKRIPFPWAIAERARLARQDRKQMRSKRKK